MKAKSRISKGFTLIELLVVIAIIGLLAAIIIPSLTASLRAARRARAMSQIQDLDGAIKRYYAEYSKMPVPTGLNGGPDQLFEGAEQAQVIRILINAPGLDSNLNPKHLTFLDLDPKSFEVKTVVEMLAALVGGEAYKDPWGNDYGILMDLNFDDKITGVGFPEIRAKAAVFSGGENGKMAAPPYKTW